MSLRNISAVRVSPDGKKAVYAVREPVMSSHRSEFLTQLFLTEIKQPDSTIRISRGEDDHTNPRWSPDGRSIAFLSNRDGRNNLYILPINGGESQRLTNVKTAVNDFKWSPDGRSICFTMNDSVSATEEKLKLAKDDWFFMDNHVKQGRLYVIRLDENESAFQPRTLTVDNRHVTSFNWSPDGKWIAYTHAASPVFNDIIYSDVSMVNVMSGEARIVANTKDGELDPVFSPDGKKIACLVRFEGGVWGGVSFIKVVDVNTNNEVRLAATPGQEPQLIGWSSDGKRIFVSEISETVTKLYRLSSNGKVVEPFNESGYEVISLAELNATGTHLGMITQNVSRPMDVFVTGTSKYSPQRISNINPAVAAHAVPKTELIRWKSVDGKEIQGLLTYPLQYKQGNKYPIVLLIHGGPAGVFTQMFIAGNNDLYPVAAYAENGMFVLRPNPRGSTGYGTAFRLANQRDWGGGDYNDLITGVDDLIARGLVDSSKMGVGGWSYGGYMTAWVVGHTKRFKAASIGAPVIDMTSFNGATDIPSFLPSYMKKQPWEDWDVYNELSPIRYVQHIQTPVLIQHGESDVRVPFSQGQLLYNALRQRGVPVRFLVLPRQSHFPSEPKMFQKIMQTNLDWMLHYLLEKPSTF